MIIDYHHVKRDETKAERGLDFEDFEQLFEGPNLTWEDTRHDYGEKRMVVMGFLKGRLVYAVWTPRGAVYHVLSMRKANDREKEKFQKAIDRLRG